MKKRNTIILLSALFTLAGCGGNTPSDSTSVDTSVSETTPNESTSVDTGVSESKPSDSVDTDSSGSSETEKPTEQVVAVTGVTLNSEVDTLKVKETLQLVYSVLPENATNKEVRFESSNPAVLTVSDTGLVTALTAGTSVVEVTTVDQNKKASLTLNVIEDTIITEDLTYDDVFTLLDQAKQAELSSATSGTLKDNLLFDVDDTFTVYQNGIQVNNASEKKLTWIENEEVKTLTLDTSVSLSSETIDGSYLTQEMAKEKASLYEEKGLSMKIKEDIFEHNSRLGNAEAKKAAKITQVDDASGRKLTVKSEAETEIFWSKAYLVQDLSISFDKEGKLLSYQYENASYDQNTYDFKNHKFKVENPTPSEEGTSVGTLVYGTRLESDENRLKESDYRIQSFDVEIDGTPSEIAVGESYSLTIKNHTPEIFIDEDFKITKISDENIVKKNNYNALRFEVLKAGDCDITVASESGVEKTISVHCVTPKVDSISFDWLMSSEVKVNEIIDIKVEVGPSGALDKSFTPSLGTGEEEFAQIINNEDGSYSLKGLKPGVVHLTVTSNENKEVSATKEITVKKVFTLEEINKALVEKDYIDGSTRLHFNADKTGSLSLYGGGEYTFNWEATADFRLNFTNVVEVVKPTDDYSFSGKAGTRISEDCTTITLVVYDSFWDENSTLTLKKEI